MVCVPCIFVGLAIVIWCKYLEPYVKPVYNRLCQIYPPLKCLGDQIGIWATKLEKFGEKFGIKMPESCPMPKKKSTKPTEEKAKLYPDLVSEMTDGGELHHRSTTTTDAQ